MGNISSFSCCLPRFPVADGGLWALSSLFPRFMPKLVVSDGRFWTILPLFPSVCPISRSLTEDFGQYQLFSLLYAHFSRRGQLFVGNIISFRYSMPKIVVSDGRLWALSALFATLCPAHALHLTAVSQYMPVFLHPHTEYVRSQSPTPPTQERLPVPSDLPVFPSAPPAFSHYSNALSSSPNSL